MKVLIIGGDIGYSAMFLSEGWKMAENLKDADLVQFTGGEDVTPDLYGHGMHRKTGNNPDRDRREIIVFQACRKQNKPMAGICRGGQFLNVMCGGKMWQDVDQHAICGVHPAIDFITGEVYNVTSTHHQMMIPGKEALLIAAARQSSFKERVSPNGTIVTVIVGKHLPVTEVGWRGAKDDDAEVLYYKEQRCLCFQPHPEFEGYADLKKKYFQYIEQYLFGKESGTCAV